VVPGYGAAAPAPVPAAPPEHWRPAPVPGVAPPPHHWRPAPPRPDPAQLALQPEWERVPPHPAPSQPGPARLPARQAAQAGPGQFGRYQRGKHERQGWARDVTSTGRIAALEDARLLLLPRRGRLPALFPRLIFVALGYAAITSLAAAYAEAVPLPITASLVVFPAVATVVLTGMRNPVWGRRALVGWLSGILATIIYDVLRLALVKVGLWGDPIPTIGRLALNDPHANFVWGYVWRFLGNGGGMGMAFAMLPWRGIRWGVIYGTMICSGLFALLFFVPVAQTHFFPLTPLTSVGAMAGHWVYGAVLGRLTSWWLPPVRLQRVRGRLVAKLAHPGPVAGKRAAAQGAGR
jgi:hypothetical protein